MIDIKTPKELHGIAVRPVPADRIVGMFVVFFSLYNKHIY